MTKPNKKPAPPRSLKSIAAGHAPLETIDEFLAGSEPTREEVLASTSISTLLAMTMVQDAMRAGDLALISKSNGVAMVVGVPGPDWVEPIHRALVRIGDWRETFKRGSSRTNDKPEVGSDAVADALGDGRNVLGVSHSPERYLPSALMTAADIRLNLGTPNNSVLRAVIGLVTLDRVRGLPAGAAQGLSLGEICSCIRRGTTAKACVNRLKAAARSKLKVAEGLDDVPLLQDTHGYAGGPREWGLNLVAAIDEWRRGERPWSSIEDRNIVLSGDAGVGKTTFARIMAKTAGVPLIATSVSSWFAATGGYLNDIVKAVDGVIAQAIAAGPAVLLLDEIDAIPNRATVDSRYREYWVPIVSHILLSLDSAVSGASGNLIIIGATNFPNRLDEALVRPGRLNRIVHISRPDVTAIGGILRQHLGDALADFDMMPVAAVGAGATGAEVAGWAKGARMAARAAKRDMVLADLLAQLAPPETRSNTELQATARHECAHAVATEVLHVGTVSTMSIVCRGQFAGRTSSRLRDQTSMSADELDAFVVTVLAGRAADARWGAVTCGSAGGPGSDLAVATGIVAAKHASFGLGSSILYRGDEVEALALIRFDPAFRKVVEADLDRIYNIAQKFVDEHSSMIEAVARRLLERRVMHGNEVRAIIGRPLCPSGIEDVHTEAGGFHE